MRTLVIGGTGNVGREVVAALLARGHDVAVLTPDDETAQQVAAGARSVAGDLRAPSSLRTALHDADRVFLLVPQCPDETALGLNAVSAARRAGIRRMVYMSVGMPHFAGRIPHFASKIPIERAVRESGMEYTILRPNNFFQNDASYREAVLEYGVYPQPIGGVGIARIDTRDIGEAAAVALTEEGHTGQTYALHGPDLLTGEVVAATYTRHLRQPVRYVGDSLDEWAATTRAFLPEWLVTDLRIMYDLYQRYGMPAADGDLERLTRLLGRAPRSFDAYAAEQVTGWTVVA